MDPNNPTHRALIIGAIVLLVGFVGFMGFRTLGGSRDYSAPGGTAARTEAPKPQTYPDGTPVPYPAAPAGAIPGDPSSIRR